MASLVFLSWVFNDKYFSERVYRNNVTAVTCELMAPYRRCVPEDPMALYRRCHGRSVMIMILIMIMITILIMIMITIMITIELRGPDPSLLSADAGHYVAFGSWPLSMAT